MQGISDKIRDKQADVLPLSAMKVDRITLNNHGVSNSDIDRIYRSLRMNSLGFYDMLNQTLASVGPDKVQLISRIWETFEALLRFCCQTEFINLARQF